MDVTAGEKKLCRAARRATDTVEPSVASPQRIVSDVCRCFTARFDRGEEAIVNAMKHFASLAAAGRKALLDRDAERLGRLMDENFDTRRRLYNLPAWQVQMVETARRCGASAKFAGSGGAIIGTYRDEGMFEQLGRELGAVNSRVIRPQVSP
jgi:glucuronokinase